MKISGYTSQVNNGGIVNATVKRVSDTMAYGGNGQGLKAVSQGIGMWADVIAKKQEEDDKQNILKAMDEYNKGRFEIMYNQDSGLMNTVADSAANIDKDYNEGMKSLRSSVMGNIKLNNRQNMVALENLMNKSDFEGYQQIAKHQYKQGEVAKDVKLGNILANNVELVQKDPANIEAAFSNNALMVSLRYQGIAGGENVAEAKVRAANSEIVAAAIGTYMDQDNYNGAQKILDTYGHFLTPAQRANIGKGLRASAELKNELNTVNSLFAQYGDDLEAAMKAIDSMNFGDAVIGKDDFFSKVAAQESGGNYGATNNRTGAFGKYQIMPENWPSWSREAGLPEGAEQTPENQEKVAKYKLGQYFDKYGAEGALVAWYSGEQNAKRWVDGEKDAIGENGQHYSWDAKQGNGDEPSIREYVNSALSQKSDTDELAVYKQREKVKQLYRNKLNDEKRLENYRNNKLADAFSAEVYKMAEGNSVTYEQAIEEARKRAGSDEDLLRKYLSSVNLWYGAKNKQQNAGGAKGEKSTNLAIAQQMLAARAFASSEEYAEYVSKIPGVTMKDIYDAKQDYKDMQEGVGKFAYKELSSVVSDVVKQIKMPDNQRSIYKAGLEKYSREAISQFYQEKKRPPTMQEAYKIVQDGAQVVNVGEFVDKGTFLGTFGFSTDIEMSPAEMRGYSIRNITQTGDNSFLVSYTDGRPDVVLTGEEIMDMRRK